MQKWYNKLTRAQVGLLWVVLVVAFVVAVQARGDLPAFCVLGVAAGLVFLALGARGE